MTWINANYDFGRHIANFVLRLNRAKTVGLKFDLRDKLEPELMHAKLREIIVESRPELHDCFIVLLNYDIASQEFVATVQHVSLPAVGYGECMPTFILEPSESGMSWRDKPSML